MAFDPKKHLVNLKGKDYLEVKWRLVWLREEHPNATLFTEMVEHDTEKRVAVFRAAVTIPEQGSATGYGMEEAKNFGDYLEKAETKAIGRALGALGFGTQFAEDFEFSAGSEPARIVDSPVERSPLVQHAQQNGARVVESRTPPSPPPPNGDPMTEPQKRAIFAIGRDMGKESEELDEFCLSRYGHRVGALSKREATDFIDQLKKAAAQTGA